MYLNETSDTLSLNSYDKEVIQFENSHKIHSHSKFNADNLSSNSAIQESFIFICFNL